MKKTNAAFIIGIILSAIAIILGIFATAFIVKAMTNSSTDGWENLGYVILSIYSIIGSGVSTLIATPVLAIGKKTLTEGSARLSKILILLDWLVPLVWVFIIIGSNIFGGQ